MTFKTWPIFPPNSLESKLFMKMQKNSKGFFSIHSKSENRDYQKMKEREQPLFITVKVLTHCT